MRWTCWFTAMASGLQTQSRPHLMLHSRPGWQYWYPPLAFITWTIANLAQTNDKRQSSK